MSYQVKTEKMIGRPASEVFRALKEGRLFNNCGGSSTTIDFRVGGKYQITFKNHGFVNSGEFLEIVPDKKIVFSWCQGSEQKPDSEVSIELFGDGPKTRLVLVHTGFRTQEIANNHQGGWDGGLADFNEEIQNGRLRMVRKFKVPIEKLYETCKNPQSFFAFMGELAHGSVDFKVGGKYQLPTEKGEIKGEFLEIVPNDKIMLSWLVGCTGPLKGSQVTLLFRNRKDGHAALELIHEGLSTEVDQKAHREGWEVVTEKLAEAMR